MIITILSQSSLFQILFETIRSFVVVVVQMVVKKNNILIIN